MLRKIYSAWLHCIEGIGLQAAGLRAGRQQLTFLPAALLNSSTVSSSQVFTFCSSALGNKSRSLFSSAICPFTSTMLLKLASSGRTLSMCSMIGAMAALYLQATCSLAGTAVLTANVGSAVACQPHGQCGVYSDKCILWLAYTLQTQQRRTWACNSNNGKTCHTGVAVHKPQGTTPVHGLGHDLVHRERSGPCNCAALAL